MRCVASPKVLVRVVVISTRRCATIDIEELLRPISDDCRGGDSSAYTRELRQQLNDLRNPPRSANPDDPEHDGGVNPVDWSAVLRKTSAALTNTTKDLRIACHLTEAALQLNGLAGLRDGLRLTRRLVRDYWDDLAPQFDPSDPETRCAPLENLLNDSEHGPRLPAAIRSLTLLHAGDLKLSLLNAMRPSDELTAASIASSVRQVPVDRAKRLSSDLDGAIEELDALQQDMIERMSDYAPSFNHLSESLGLIRRWFDSALKQQLQFGDSNADTNADDSRTAESIATQPAESSESAARIVGVRIDQSLRVRADAYRQLTEAANVLQRMEPHSPIPYMVHRAVQLGQMPFPKLMSQWVKEESTLEMFCRELGLPSTDGTDSRAGN